MLTRVEIQDFRSCKNVVLDDMRAMLVLVGPNGAGKTNVLHAIQWAAQAAVGSEPPAREPETASVVLQFRLKRDEYRYSIKKRIWDPGVDLAERFERRARPDGWTLLAGRSGSAVEEGPVKSIAEAAPMLPMILATMPAGGSEQASGLGWARRIHDFLGGLRYYPLDEPAEYEGQEGVVSVNEYRRWLAKRPSRIARRNPFELELVHLWETDRAGFKSFRKLIGPKQLQLVEMRAVVGFDAVDRHSAALDDLHEKYYGLVFLPVGPRGRRPRAGFSFRDLSLGTRRLLRLMLSLVADRATVMLIEHPEDGIHRGLVQKVFAVLRSYRQRTQVIVATHSTSVLNRFEPDEVRLVTMKSGRTRARGLRPNELDAAKRYIEEEGTLSDYLELTADG